MIEVSVIVPIYNAEQYLRRCLDSLCNQTFSQYEIILVDDGSTDTSGCICDEYANKYSNIIACHQKNGGISRARNKGIELSSGRWIMFCDSDDTVSPNWIEVLFNAAELNSEYLVNCEYEAYNVKTENATRASIPNVIEPQRFDIEDYFLFYQYGYCPYVWDRIYNKSIITQNHISFSEDYSCGEDVIFNLDYIKYCKGFYYIPQVCYRWINNNEISASRRYNPDFFKLRESLYLKRKPFISSKYLQDFYNLTFVYLYETIMLLLDSNQEGIVNKYRKCKSILKSDSFKEVLSMADEATCSNKMKKLIRTNNIIILYMLKYKYYND